MRDMKIDRGICYIDFSIPTRGLIGIRNEFLTATKGLGILNSIFIGYEPFRGERPTQDQGSLVASESGISNTYGLLNAQGRGVLFIGPGVPVYEGMVVGQNAKAGDIYVNVCKAKELTNFRSKNMGVREVLDVPHLMDLEEALEYIGDDELVEITPKNIRIRKVFLTEIDRKKAGRR
jgi:GTP-binding protein